MWAWVAAERLKRGSRLTGTHRWWWTDEPLITALTRQVQKRLKKAGPSLLRQTLSSQLSQRHPRAWTATACGAENTQIRTGGEKKEKRKPQVNIIQIFKCLHVCKNNLFFRGIWPNDMFVLHTLHYYVAIVCSGSCRALSHSWGISAYVCSASLLGHTSARSLNSLLHPVGTRWQTIVLDTARFLKWKQFVFYTEQGSVARFLWLGRQLCFLNPMKWLCVFVCVCPSLEALVYWWFKNNQVVRAYYSALFKFYVRQLRINSVCAGVCLLTLLHRMSTVSVCCCPLWLPLIQPLFSGQKPISHLPVREVHHEGFFLPLCLFYPPFHLPEAVPQLNARITPNFCQLLVVPTVGPATPWRTLMCRIMCV